MSKLDFSGLNRIAYQGFEEQEERDSLLQAGYTVVTGEPIPFPNSQDSPQPSAAHQDQEARDYRGIYRAAYEYHQRHRPTINREYWKKHKPGEDEPPAEDLDFWQAAAQDLSRCAGDDPFLQALLIAVYDEIWREYQRMINNAHKAA